MEKKWINMAKGSLQAKAGLIFVTALWEYGL